METWEEVHAGVINGFSLSPDGTKLASVSEDKTLRFWDTHSGEPIGEPLEHDSPLHRVTFAPSGEFIAYGEHRSDHVSIRRVPWWYDSQKKQRGSLLDLPALPTQVGQANIHGRTHHELTHELDFLDLPATHRPSASTGPSSLPRNPLLTLARRLFRRKHDLPRVTPIFTGFAEPGGRGIGRNTPQPMPIEPGHYPGFSIIAESISSSDTPDSDPAPEQPDHPPSSTFCCGLFTRRRKDRPGADSAPGAVELSQLPASASNAAAPPLVASSQPMTPKVLDVPVVQSPTRAP
ncbi:hypothetical protein BU15DRAFT_83684 [Melanogaster broomeanus]|nr:hypothetical protein BU15DRAFT_83684 [Melanogaster broomeanus]